MSDYTEHYNLKKPKQSENYNVDDANTNNTIIDTTLFGKVDKIPGKGLSENDFSNNYKQKIDMLQNIYKFKGSVETLEKLNEITGQKSGDVYNVISENKDYAFNGTEWAILGSATNVDDLATKTEIKVQKGKVVINTAVLKGGAITLPFYYKVGTHCLDVYYMGELLRLSSDDAGTDGHYREIGESGSMSNQIKTTTDWEIPVGRYFDFVVRGEYSND